MIQYKQNYELKNAAKDKLDGKYGGAILIFILSSLISNIVTLLVSSIGDTTLNAVYYTEGSAAVYNIIYLLFTVIDVLTAVICAVMNAGITLYFLNMACGMPFSIRDLFYGFQNDSKKSLTVAAAIVLCQVVCLWPSQYLLQNLLLTHEFKWFYYAAAAFVIGLCIYIPVALGIALSFYLMLDYPQNSAKETLSLCWRMMRGQRRRLFLLELSFLPLMLLCVLSFGIGFLWLEPYMQMTHTYFFLDLMNPGSQPDHSLGT